MTTYRDFLLEIYTEELPPKSLLRLSQALGQEIKRGLEAAKLQHGEIKTFATPHRLAVFIQGLERKQPDHYIERKGPFLKVAFDEQGNPTQAGLGFAKSCGVSLEQIETITEGNEQRLLFKKTEKGRSVYKLMLGIVETAIAALPIEKPMRWSNRRTAFARPVHSVIMLYGRDIIRCRILSKKTDNTTRGHRFHTEKPLVVKSPQDYEIILRKHGYVIADFEERKRLIQEQIEKLTAEYRAVALMNDELLEEVTALVEWPVALIVSFPERFLKLPKEVLISSIQGHQKCFPIVDGEGNLLPYFITIANLESKKPEEIIKGNERVMNARLADAAFFYKVDTGKPLSEYLSLLKNVRFEASLGSLFDKSERVAKLAVFIAGKIGADAQLTERAALLSKADLVTNMVGEFPALQGIMGRYYAEKDLEPQAIAMALEEVYMPRGAQGELPKTLVGQIIAIADRLDTLVGIFGVNKMPTGEKDPFGLRRAAIAIIRILAQVSPLSLTEIISKAAALYGNLLVNLQVEEQVLLFILERLKHWLMGQEFTADQFKAVAANPINSIPDFIERIDAVRGFCQLKEAESLTAAHKRVNNILMKLDRPLEDEKVNTDLLKEEAEILLAEALKKEQGSVSASYSDRLKTLASLREPVDRFFDEVMVMAEDKALRENRLALLLQLRHLFLEIADISFLEMKKQ